MAIRNIRKEGDEVLRKKSKPVEEVNEKIVQLLKDMAETMRKTSNGVGLAAPQVGVLKRVVVIDYEDKLYEFVNPVIIEQSGEQTCVEGCLSIPGVYGEVKRPNIVKVEALDVNGKKYVIDSEGFLSVILCHEIDHLDGVLFKDKAVRILDKDEISRDD